MSSKFNFYLHQELIRRQSTNPRYSLRAFAKSLSLTHASLSMYLNGKRRPSKNTLKFIEEKISIPSNLQSKGLENLDDDGFQKIDLQHYALISDWAHFAILSLLETKGAKLDTKWIAKKLSLSEEHTASCISRLIDYKILNKCKNGKWKQSTPPLKVDNQIALHATKTLHTRLLGKAIQTLDKSQFNQRVFSGVCMAIDEDLMPFARKRIQSFQRTLMRQLESKGKKKQVYYLTLQLFPVSENEK